MDAELAVVTVPGDADPADPEDDPADAVDRLDVDPQIRRPVPHPSRTRTPSAHRLAVRSGRRAGPLDVIRGSRRWRMAATAAAGTTAAAYVRMFPRSSWIVVPPPVRLISVTRGIVVPPFTEETDVPAGQCARSAGVSVHNRIGSCCDPPTMPRW